MKTIKLLSALTCLFMMMAMMSCGRVETKATAAPATVEELGQMNRDFAKTLTAKDAVAAAALYDVNASIFPPNEPIVTGRANIQKYWQGAIDAGIIDAAVKTMDAKSDGDIGYETGTFQMRFKGAKGDTTIETGKYMELLKRGADGKWISTHGMWSTNEPARLSRYNKHSDGFETLSVRKIRNVMLSLSKH